MKGAGETTDGSIRITFDKPISVKSGEKLKVSMDIFPDGRVLAEGIVVPKRKRTGKTRSSI